MNLPAVIPPSISLVHSKTFEAAKDIRKMHNIQQATAEKLIMRCFLLIGGNTETISKETVTLMIDFLRRNYASTSHDEVLLAVEYAIIKRTNVNKQHFGTLSSEYLSECINAYKTTVKAEMYKQIEIEKRKEEEKEFEKLSDQECLISLIQFVQQKKEIPLASAYWWGAYDHANKLGEIKATKEEKINMLNEKIKSFQADITNKAFRRAILNLKEKGKYEVGNEYRSLKKALDFQLFDKMDDLIVSSALKMFENECKKDLIIEYLKTHL